MSKQFILALLLSSAAWCQTSHLPKPYALQSWKNLGCRAKGRFQDQTYCQSPVIDRIIADGKPAIPVLISQITDARWIEEPVYDYWPRIGAGN
jgi:hypothetical protein